MKKVINVIRSILFAIIFLGYLFEVKPRLNALLQNIPGSSIIMSVVFYIWIVLLAGCLWCGRHFVGKAVWVFCLAVILVSMGAGYLSGYIYTLNTDFYNFLVCVCKMFGTLCVCGIVWDSPERATRGSTNETGKARKKAVA